VDALESEETPVAPAEPAEPPPLVAAPAVDAPESKEPPAAPVEPLQLLGQPAVDALERSESPAATVEPVPPPVATVLRFDLHQRLQHGLLASSFVLLVVTGWPLAAHSAKASASAAIVALFGGIERCSGIHRIAAIVMVIASLYHLAYLAVLASRRGLSASMLPSPGDLRNLGQNLLFFVGKRGERPKFPRFSYFEKFDYWAVFWGVAIMVGSGLVRWFPVEATGIFPPWVYEIAHYAHADEALLAALAIFIWHFYNVHLRPGVFPMSRVFLTGRLTLEQLQEEHGAEYEELMRARAQAEAKAKEGG